ncbi:DUF1524 domain-containing protein [Kocuria sp. M1R5S2]|uniref:GmrSD restriction endonuclease domain-containing protein n=1 Tax=Kocuria rhizosphaerae TaxID=3376285 RepID=UPI0037BC2143
MTPRPAARAGGRPGVPLTVALLALGLLAGCGPRPVEDVSPAEQALDGLSVRPAGPGEGYDRLDRFGAWADPDGNGCDARNDVLARDLTGEVVDDGGCTVLSGTLEDPYTGDTIDFQRGVLTSAEVQVDHVVALYDAWVSGADRLPRAERVALANDPLNLRAVDGPTNGEKSAANAAAWLPPRQEFRCEYVAVQIAVKTRYGLSVTPDERDAMAGVLAGCPGQALPDARAAAPEPAGPSTAAGVYYENCAAVREAGAAPLRSGDPGYRPALDRGGTEGVACEG